MHFALTENQIDSDKKMNYDCFFFIFLYLSFGFKDRKAMFTFFDTSTLAEYLLFQFLTSCSSTAKLSRLVHFINAITLRRLVKNVQNTLKCLK